MSTEGEVAAKEAHELHRTLGPWQLIALGIGAIIGAGIFVITGHAAATYAGPGVVISFMIAGLGCFFAGLCYAEFACMIPVAGSAYTYTYATMGRFLAWFIGWNLVLEYLAAASTVAVGWAGYFVQLLSQLGITIPRALSSAPLAMTSLTDENIVADMRAAQGYLQGTDFVGPDSDLGKYGNNNNDRPFLTDFPYFAPPHPRPGDSQ
jgi:APA family basic amino acid/polyamine antiporter